MGISGDHRLHILIYGAGATGSFIGGLLAATGHPVTLLGRKEICDVVRQHGLELRRPTGRRVLTPPVVTSLNDLPRPPDIVLVTIKAYSIEAALPDLERLAQAGTMLVTMQNGVGTEERLLRSPHINRLAAGTLTLSISALAPGTVQQETRGGGITFAPVRGDASLHSLARELRLSGVPVLVARDYRQMKWSKLLLNMLANATAAILAMPPVAIYADPRLFNIERAAFFEALAGMRASTISPIALPGFNVPLLARAMRLPSSLARWLIASRAARGRGDKRPSLWIDIDNGRSVTEIDWLNRAIAQRCGVFDIPAPVNTGLADLVDEIAREPSRRDTFAGRPQTLIDQLKEYGWRRPSMLGVGVQARAGDAVDGSRDTQEFPPPGNG